MLIHKILENKRIILASNSPRRKDFLTQLGIPFEVRASNAEETYPKHFIGSEITDYIALRKTNHCDKLAADEIIIASDTIVWHENKALGKPNSKSDAMATLKSLSGKTHQVISSVCLKSAEKTLVFHDITLVSFQHLLDEEIAYYVDNYEPYDKAGAYGIQEWIGLIGIKKIEGSYTNVVGLPMEKLYHNLINFVT